MSAVKLFEKYPLTVSIENKTYRVKPYFNRVLKVIDIMETPGLSDADKIVLASEQIYKKCPVIIGGKVVAAFFESLEQEKGESGIQTIDFEQDAGYIRSAFFQTYGIRLEEQHDKMTWFEFIELFQSLPDNTKIMQIADIRARPLPKPDKYNGAEIAQLQKLKRKYAIKNVKVDYAAQAAGWNKIFDSLKER